MTTYVTGALASLTALFSTLMPAESAAQERLDVEVAQMVGLAVHASIDERRIDLDSFSGRVSIVNGSMTELTERISLSAWGSQRALGSVAKTLGANIVQPVEGKWACIDSAERSCFVPNTDLLFWPRVAEYDGKTALIGVHFQMVGPGDPGLRKGGYNVEMEKAGDRWRVTRMTFVTG